MKAADGAAAWWRSGARAPAARATVTAFELLRRPGGRATRRCAQLTGEPPWSRARRARTSACPRRCARRSRCAPSTPATSSASRRRSSARGARGDRAAGGPGLCALAGTLARGAPEAQREARPATLGQAGRMPGDHPGRGADPARAPEEAPRRARAGRMSGFIDTLQHAWAAHDSLVCVGLDPEIERFPRAHRRRSPRPSSSSTSAIIDATARPGVRLQAAVRALRRLRGGGSARAHHRVHPQELPAGAGDPRRQARRRRQHRRALRHRGVRALRRRCGHRESLPRHATRSSRSCGTRTRA